MYLILNPHSNTNPTGLYRVVDSFGWGRYARGAALTYEVFGEFRGYAAAERERDARNAAAK